MRVGDFTSTNYQSKCEFDACKVIRILQGGVIKGSKLEFIVDNLTLKDYVDSFIQYIKSNHSADITSFVELIFPSTGVESDKGEIVPYLTRSLIKAIAEIDENHLDIGKKIRNSVHKNILSSVITSQFTMKHPELLLMAAVIFPGEHGAPSVEITSMIEKYHKNDLRPQWWHSFPPENNAFTLKSIKSIAAHYESERHLSKVFSVKPDGACFFRAYMAIKLSDDFWLSRATKGEVLSVINYKGDLDNPLRQGSTSLGDVIKEQIHEAICELKSVYSGQDTIERTLLDKLDAERLYDKTIGNGRFDLYCADGVKNGFNKSDLKLVNDCDEFFTIISDAIGNRLMEKLGLGTRYEDADDAAYLKQNDSHDHFDVVAPGEYFDRVTNYDEIYNGNVYSPASLNFIQDTSIPPNELINRVVNSRVKRREFTGRLLEACCLAMTANIQPTSADMGLRLQQPLALCEPGEDNPHTVFSNQVDACWIGYSELENKEQAQIIKIECSGHQGNGLAYVQYGINGRIFNGENAFFKAITYAKNNALSDIEIEKKAKKLSYNIMGYLRSHAEKLGLLLQRGIEDGLGLECGKVSIDECEWRPAAPPAGPSNTGSGIASAALALMQLMASGMNGYRADIAHRGKLQADQAVLETFREVMPNRDKAAYDYKAWQWERHSTGLWNQRFPKTCDISEKPVVCDTLDWLFTAKNCVDTPQAGAANGNDGVASSLFNISSSVVEGVFNLVDGISTALDKGASYLPPYLVGADAAPLGNTAVNSLNSDNGMSETKSIIDGVSYATTSSVVWKSLPISINISRLNTSDDILSAIKLVGNELLKVTRYNSFIVQKFLDVNRQSNMVLGRHGYMFNIGCGLEVARADKNIVLPGLIALPTFFENDERYLLINILENPPRYGYVYTQETEFRTEGSKVQFEENLRAGIETIVKLTEFGSPDFFKPLNTKDYPKFRFVKQNKLPELVKSMAEHIQQNAQLQSYWGTTSKEEVTTESEATKLMSTSSSEPPPLTENITTNEVGDVSFSTDVNSRGSAPITEATRVKENTTTNEVGDVSSSTVANSIASQLPATSRPPFHFALSEGTLDFLIKIKCRNFVTDATQPLVRRQAVQQYLDGTRPGKTLWHGNAIFIDFFALESPDGLVVFSLPENWHTFIPQRLHIYDTDCRESQAGGFHSKTTTYCNKNKQRYFDWDNNWEFKAKMRVATPRFPSEINDWVFRTDKPAGGPVVQNLFLSVSGRPLVEELLPRLNEPRHLPWLSKIQDHLQKFGDEPDLFLLQLKEDLFNISRPLLDDAMIERMATYMTQQADLVFASFFNPVHYVDNEIIKEIKKYERNIGHSTNLKPDSLLEITIYDSTTAMAKESDFTKHQGTVREFALGHFHRSKPLSSIIMVEGKHREFLKKLKGKISNIQNDMFDMINDYKNSPLRMNALQTHYRGEIILRCLKLLEAPDNKVAVSHKNLIIDFLLGKNSAMGVSLTSVTLIKMHGTPLRNLFFIPSGKKTDPLVEKFRKYMGFEDLPPNGIFLSLDDDRVWELTDETMINLVKNTEFRNFVLKAFMRKDLPNAENAFKFKGIDTGGVYTDYPKKTYKYYPLNVFPMGGVEDVAKSLTNIGLDHLHSNINHLFYTDTEGLLRVFRSTAQELISLAMQYTSLVGIPTGIIGRVLMLSLQAGLSAGSVALSVNEYLMATTDSEKDAALNDIVIGSLCGALMTPEFFQIGKAVSNPARLMAGYSRIKSMSSDLRQQLVWQKSGLANKVKLLVDKSPAAQELTRAFGVQRLAIIIRNELSGLQSGTEIRALSTELGGVLAEYRRTYPLNFYRSSPVNNNPVNYPVVAAREPIREIVQESTSRLTLPTALSNAEDELRAMSNIGPMMAEPASKCEAVVTEVTAFMQQKSMTDIRVRGMYIWANGGDYLPVNHFVLIGRLDNQDYIFDVTAAQFSPAIDTPLILPLSAWERRYQQAWRTKVIKYADFDSLAGARSTFGSTYVGVLPSEVMPGVKVLAAPAWYRAQSLAASSSQMMPVRYGDRTSLHSAVRHSIARGYTGDAVYWDYAADMLLQSGGGRPELAQQLKQLATRSRLTDIAPDIRSVLSGSRQLTSLVDALSVQSGELLVFVREQQVVHVMVSLGAGRWAGMKNDALNPLLGGGRQIVSVEQLGQFGDNHRLRPWENSNKLVSGPVTSELTVYAGMPVSSSVPQPIDNSAMQGVTSILKACGLAPEQAVAFERQISNPNVISSALLSARREITQAEQLRTLPKGAVVVAGTGTSADFWIHAGGGRFASFKFIPDNAGGGRFVSTSPVALVDAKDIRLDSGLLAGQVDVQRLRAAALFGPDMSITFNRNSGTLTAQLHGAPSNINHMDAGEFANALRGWMISRNEQSIHIKRIAFQSCFSAFGLCSSGQVLANEFNVEVTAYRWRYSIPRADDFLNRVKFQPMPAETPAQIADLRSFAIKHANSHEFWEWLLTAFYSRVRTRVARAVEETDQIDWREAYPQIGAVASLVSGRGTIDSFLGNNENAWLWGGLDLNLTDGQRRDFKKQMESALRDILSPSGNETISIEVFKQRCEEVMRLNPYTYFYVKDMFE